ncbi:MAG: DUF2927 domain-containing protein [Pseudomonadota bacterium]
MKARFALLACAALMACEAQPPTRATPLDTPTRTVETLAYAPRVLPKGVARSNAQLAQDFLDLTFALESGERLNRLLRHQGPVRVYLRGPRLNRYARDLDNLLNRIRVEAGIDIARTKTPDDAQIHISGVSSRQIDRAFRGAACFVTPGVRNWAEFWRAGRGRAWSSQDRLTLMSIFLPTDAPAQEVRDCLHEEIAQALGPANDLFRLPASVFNDDNDHGILTPFDMVMLRVLYSDQLKNGMSRAEVSAEIGGVLNRINPKGRVRSKPVAPTSTAWDQTMKRAFNRRLSASQRLLAADTAVRLAADMLPQDHRLGVALITRGRLSEKRNAQRAATDFAAAHAIMERVAGPRSVRTSKAALHLARSHLRSGRPEAARRLARASQDAAKRAEDAILLSGLYLIESEAAKVMGDVQAAREAQLNSLMWARLGFGDRDGRIASAQAELKALMRPERTAE